MWKECKCSLPYDESEIILLLVQQSLSSNISRVSVVMPMDKILQSLELFQTSGKILDGSYKREIRPGETY